MDRNSHHMVGRRDYSAEDFSYSITVLVNSILQDHCILSRLTISTWLIPGGENPST